MFLDNPVFIKELKSKMRGRQGKQGLIVATAIAAVFVVWCYYQAISVMLRFGGADVGKDGWQVAVGMQAILIWLLGPSMAANAITQEKEQQTWEMMVFTRLSGWEILLGKMMARMLPLLVMLAAFAPFTVFCYVRSISLGLGAIAVTYVTFAVWVFFLLTVSLFMSWAFKRTASAIAVSYLVLFLLLIGTVTVEATLSIGASRSVPTPIVWLNPVYITAALFERDATSLIDPTTVLLFSNLFFFVLSLFLLWRMNSRFRTFAVE